MFRNTFKLKCPLSGVLKACLILSETTEGESDNVLLCWLLYIFQQFRNEMSNKWCQKNV